MEATQTFSQKLSVLFDLAKKAVQDKLQKEALEELREFFQGAEEKASPYASLVMKEFSDAVTTMMGNPFFDESDRDLIKKAIMIHMDATHPSALKVFLESTRDEEVAMLCMNQFLTVEPDLKREIPYNDPIVWKTKRALCAIQVMDDARTPEFADIALSMFPGMPLGKGEGEWGFRGVLLSHSKKNNSALSSSDGRTVVRRPRVPSWDRKGSDRVESSDTAPQSATGVFTLEGNKTLLKMREKLVTVSN